MGTGRPDGSTRNRAAEFGLDQRRNSRGSLAADYDRDGWLDLFVVNLTGTSALFRNGLGDDEEFEGRHFLSLKLVGDPTLPGELKSTRDALGARVFVSAQTVSGADPISMRRDVHSGSGNAAGTDSLRLYFGLGEATVADVTIQWPSGRITTLPGVAADGFYTVMEVE